MNKRNEIGGSIEEFSIEKEIGHGGFATVYKAKCLNTNRNVAIKKIDKNSISSRGLTDRVRQEVSIHSKLDHPAILKLYTFFEDHHHVYLILELCFRGELYKHIKSLNRVLTENEGRQYLYQVVGGMLYLHSQAIMHRDLTLTNLLLDDNGNIKIADFGLATQLARPDDRHTTMCGTPNYISPEVATRSSHGLEADVWSIGCMLYTMLVGHPPFDTHGIKSTLTKVVIGEYKIPSHVSADASDLVSKCLTKNPRNRIALQSILQHPFMNYNKKSEYSGMADSGLYSMSTMTISTQNNTRYLPLGTISESDSEESESGPMSHRRPSARHPSSPPVKMRSNPRDLLASNAGIMGSLKRKFTALPTLHAVPANGLRRERDVSEERRWQQEKTLSHRSNSSSEGYTDSSSTYSSRPQNKNIQRGVNPHDGIDYVNNLQPGNFYNHNQQGIHFNGNSYERGEQQTSRTEEAKFENQNFPGYQYDPKSHLNHKHNERSNDRYVKTNMNENQSEQVSYKQRELSSERSSQRGRSRERSSERYTEPVKDVPENFYRSGSQERRREKRIHSFCQNSQHVSSCDCQRPKEVRTESHSLHMRRSRHDYEGTSTSGIGIASNNSSNSKCSNKQHQPITSNNMLYDIEPVKRTPSPMEDPKTQNNKSHSQQNPSTTKRKTGSQTLQQQCSPLSSRRLRATRQHTNNAILNILDTGEVCIEFLTNRKGQEKVSKVCRISEDGMRVVLYEPHRGVGVTPADTPPPLPEDGADSIFSYENLPSKHWKKYIYASRFVKLVKSKTPKVTYHSDQAKCILMENSPDPDFEAHFYNGSKIMSAGNNVTVTDMSGISHSLTISGNSCPSLPELLQPLYTHAKKIHDHCLYLERVLSETSDKSGLSCFPVVMGRKPSWASGSKQTSTPQGTNKKSTVKQEDKENSSPGSVQSYRANNNFAAAHLGAYEASVLSIGTQGGGSGGKFNRTPLGTNNTTPNRQDNQVFVPNIGWASKSPAGDLSVDYLDGSGLQVSSRSPHVVFWTRGNTPKTYSTNERLPPQLQHKLSCMPQVLDSLAAGKQQSWSAGTTPLRTLR